MRNLWMLYDLWHATTGESLAAKTPHTRASMLSFIHQTLPTLDRVAPTGDQSRDSTASFFDYHRNYLQELVALYPHDALAPRAQGLLAASSVPAMADSFMAADDFLYDQPDVGSRPLDGLGPTYYAPGIGELYTRSGWDSHATWINLIAGPYTEAHAHQDQGALMIYKDGWLAYDAVIDSHSGLTQETTAHGLVRITSGGQPVRQIGSGYGAGALEPTTQDVDCIAGEQHVSGAVAPFRRHALDQPDVAVVEDQSGQVVHADPHVHGPMLHIAKRPLHIAQVGGTLAPAGQQDNGKFRRFRGILSTSRP
jgi:hypothetical protein